MRKTITSILGVLLFASLSWAQVAVTFQVDMSLASPAPDTVSVAGNFQVAAGSPSDWTPGDILLSDQGNGLWAVTVSIPAGSYEYKFINGTAWGQDESIPGLCAVNGNRGVTVPNQATLVIPAPCFASCNPCSVIPDTVDVTIRVAMHEVAKAGVLSDTITVAGNFQSEAGFSGDWSPGETIMTDTDMDSIYDVTVRIPEGIYEYKFINGTAWGQDESVPAACAVNNNRQMIIVGDSNLSSITTEILPSVYYDSCSNYVIPTSPVTFQVDMSLVSPAADTVTIAGDFQMAAGYPSNWNPGEVFLNDQGNGIWSVTLNLPPGTYQYKFINGTAWGQDEMVPAQCAVNNNRQVVIPSTAPYTVPLVCYAQCGPCSNPVIPDSVDVTFRVAMHEIAKLGLLSDTISIAGSFQSETGQSMDWIPGVTLLDDSDMDSIYEITLRIPEGYYEYKFINGTAWGQDETVPMMCANNNNRGINVVSDSNLATITTDILDPVYFDSCSNYSPPMVLVTLQVDMSLVNPIADTVSVAGNFQAIAGFSSDWNPGETVMSPQGNDVYAVTFAVPGGVYEYKFINGTAWGQDEGVPAQCAVNQNREMTVPNNGSITIPLVCFGLCGPCPSLIDTVDVTFRVAMHEEAIINGLEDTVSIAGNFQIPGGFPNNWAPGESPMSDLNQDSVYELTVRLPEGFYEYKFINGTAWGQDESVPDSCSIGLNRFMEIFGDGDPMTITDTILPAFYYDSCSVYQSGASSLAKNEQSSIKVYPNPFDNICQLVFENEKERFIEVLDLNGKSILTQRSNARNTKLDLSNQVSGMYILNVFESDGSKVHVSKLLLN